MTAESPRRGTRDNGLRCGGYAAVADLDPRVADGLLTTLRDAGIAAYASPAPGESSGYLENRPSQRPADRLWVDDQMVEQARALIAAEQEPAPTDIDAAWQQVLASLQTTSDSPVPPWPVSEDVDLARPHVVRPAATGETATAGAGEGDYDDDDEYDEPDDAHFVPPPAPPLPRLQRPTVLALLSIGVGLVLLATQFDGGSFNWLAILAILGGLASLVWRMRDDPPTDSGWDDGAVL